MERWTKGKTVGHTELDWPLLWHTVSTCSVLIEPTVCSVDIVLLPAVGLVHIYSPVPLQSYTGPSSWTGCGRRCHGNAGSRSCNSTANLEREERNW